MPAPPAGLAAQSAGQPLALRSNWYRRIVSERDVHGIKPFEATDDAPSPVCSGSACHLAEPLRRPDLRTVLSFCTRDAAAVVSAALPDAASCQRPQITSTRGFVAVSTKQLNCFACKKFSSTALLWHEHSRNLADMRVPCGVGPTMALHLSA